MQHITDNGFHISFEHNFTNELNEFILEGFKFKSCRPNDNNWMTIDLNTNQRGDVLSIVHADDLSDNVKKIRLGQYFYG